MKTKKLILGIIIILYIWVGNIFSVDLSFPYLSELLSTKFVPIHYHNGNGTNLQDSYGIMIVKETEILDNKENIILNGETLSCYMRLRGYYFNTVRGNYILGLTQKDKNDIENVLLGNSYDMTGGFYTACDGKGNNVYGYIKYSTGSTTIGQVYVGLSYDIKQNNIRFGSGFVGSFQMYGGTKPVGFIYDSVGGVALVGGSLSGQDLNVVQTNILDKNQISISYTNNELVINGINIGGEGMQAVVKSIIGLVGGYSVSNANFQNNDIKKIQINQMFADEQNGRGTTKFAYNIGNLGNISVIRNKVKKKIYELCAGKWENVRGIIEYKDISPLDDINCLDAEDGTGKVIINYDLSISDKYPILVTKGNIDVIIKKSMGGDAYIQMYIDKGNLMIDNDIYLDKIGKGGEVVENSEYTSGVVINGIFIVNGLLGGYENSVGFTGFKHKLYIKGMLSSLNTVSTPRQSRIDYANDVLGEYGNIYDKDDINLLKVFKWRCQDDGVGTDGVNCSNPNDRWWQNSLIFLKRNYDSVIIK